MFLTLRVSSLALILGAVTLRAPIARAQCDQEHYRWDVKTSKDLLTKTGKRVTVAQILNTWPIPELYAGNSSECAARADREENVYSITAWVRRRVVETPPSGDGDWHIELTAKKTGEVRDHCVVVEVPDPQYGHQFKTARESFNKLIADANVTIDSDGDLSTPVRMRFIGPAFFDAEHRGAKGTDKPPHQHGRCNSSSRALWEIHPVFAVRSPPK